MMVGTMPPTTTSLLPCPHCDSHVRREETTCPICDGALGAPRKLRTTSSAWTVGLAVASMVGVVAIPACAYGYPPCDDSCISGGPSGGTTEATGSSTTTSQTMTNTMTAAEESTSSGGDTTAEGSGTSSGSGSGSSSGTAGDSGTASDSGTATETGGSGSGSSSGG